jgi:hypothetical protein
MKLFLRWLLSAATLLGIAYYLPGFWVDGFYTALMAALVLGLLNAIFELEIITEKKRIRFENFGQEMVTQDVVRDPIFKGFKALSKRKVTMTKLVDAMPELYRHAAEVLNKKKSSRSSLADAMKTQAACFRLLESITSKK